jgi:hypothetical protein
MGRSDAQRGPDALCKLHDALRWASLRDSFGAGRFGPIASLLVERDVQHRASPRALRWAQIGSVRVHPTAQDKV